MSNGFNYRLVKHTEPPRFEDLDPPQSFGDEDNAMQAAQAAADRLGEPIDIIRTHPGRAESQPYKTVHPSLS